MKFIVLLSFLSVFGSAQAASQIHCGYPFNGFSLKFDALGFAESASAGLGYSSYNMICQEKSAQLIECTGSRVQAENQKLLKYKALVMKKGSSVRVSFTMTEVSGGQSRLVQSANWEDCR